MPLLSIRFGLEHRGPPGLPFVDRDRGASRCGSCSPWCMTSRCSRITAIRSGG